MYMHGITHENYISPCQYRFNYRQTHHYNISDIGFDVCDFF